MNYGNITDIQKAQGWSDETLLLLALDFIAEQGCEEHFEKQLRLAAEAENRHTDV